MKKSEYAPAEHISLILESVARMIKSRNLDKVNVTLKMVGDTPTAVLRGQTKPNGTGTRYHVEDIFEYQRGNVSIFGAPAMKLRESKEKSKKR